MLMNAPLRIGVSVGVVTAVAFVAFALGRRSVTAPPREVATTSSTELARARKELDVLRARNRELAQRTPPAIDSAASRVAPRAPDSTPSLERLRVLAEAQRSKEANVRITIVGRTGELGANFVKLFELTDAEQGALRDAIAQGRQRIEQLVAANTTARREGDAFVIATRPFDGGGDVYDSVMEAFAQTLGPERNAAFLSLENDQLANAFSGFGAERRTVTLTREIPPNGGDPQIMVRDERRGTRNSMSSLSPLNNADGIQEQFKWLAPYLDQVAALPARPRGSPPRF